MRQYNNRQQREDSDDEQEQTIAVINQRDARLYEMRRHYGSIISQQTDTIRIFSRKNELLIAIALILTLLVLLTWLSFSSDQCTEQDDDLRAIEKVCMNDHMKLNCTGTGKKDPYIWEQCEQLSKCLKDPLKYK